MVKWGELSIARKLYLVVGVMAVLIAGELMTLRFSMTKLSAVRAFVGAEGLWSKSQKNAALNLQRYAVTHDEADYTAYLNALKIPEGDHQARIEMMKPQPDLAVVRAGFLQGQIHPDDIDPVIDLLQRFYWISYLQRSIAAWTEGDRLLGEFKEAGTRFHAELASNSAEATQTLRHIGEVNEKLSVLENEFSDSLSEGSRWMERIVNRLLMLAVLMVEAIGLTLTFRTSRRISRGLAELNSAARAIGEGDFSRLGKGWTSASSQRDEIALLADSLTQMGNMLEKSYVELENRVRERTAELERMADDNARLYMEATEALGTRDEFLSIASHELKTPLSSLILQLQLAERMASKKEGSSDQIAILKKASARGRHLARLIEELLDLARIRAGKFVLVPEDSDLRDVVTEAVLEIGPDAERAATPISLDAEIAMPGRFDPLRMGQVVTNLISNAIKYGSGKPIEVKLGGNAEIAELTVRDHGIGIPPEKQGIIFERFERAGANPGISGLGLGLFVVRQIVAAHGGEVTVSSQPGEGSCFTVTVPRIARRELDGGRAVEVGA